jgi:DNA-binding transcriptional ArsR family regulator
MYAFSHALWFHFFKKPADQRPDYPVKILKEIRNFFFECEWYEVYDFLEWVVLYLGEAEAGYEKLFNAILERELAGYRFVAGKIVDITNTQELEMLEQAIDDSKFSGAAAHLKRALELLADRKAPDYRNSVKESISAVESIARTISGAPKATLGEALKVLEKAGKVHPALKDGFLKLYGYTSDAEGIRHAMLDEPNVTQADARFMLLSCTSFVNYLKAQL